MGNDTARALRVLKLVDQLAESALQIDELQEEECAQSEEARKGGDRTPSL